MKKISRIGSGGFGVVDLVEDTTGQQFAQKTFSVNQASTMPDDLIANVKKRFIREANVQGEISHNNIVAVLQKNLSQDPPSFIMPLATSTLSDDISKSKNLDGNYRSAFMDILAGLEEIHSLGIYHRDLKPQNVLKFEKDGETTYAISDFGLMSITDTQLSVLTQTGMKMGSDFYTAPEIIKDLRKASARSDIYSAGCILHDFVGTDERIVCNPIIDDNSAYADILKVCTRKEPARRFQTISDLREAILSIDPSTISVAKQETATYIEIIDSDQPIDITNWRNIVTYLQDNAESSIDSDINALLSKLNIARIDELISKDQDLAITLGVIFAEWARNGTFDFDFCDGLANRLLAFYVLDDISCKSEVLLALLFMGTTHNRWYVERKFIQLAGANMDSNLARRVAMEISVSGQPACRAFTHLTRSISANLNDLHPSIYEKIRRVCN
jgi:serine/threonine protein kinase